MSFTLEVSCDKFIICPLFGVLQTLRTTVCDSVTTQLPLFHLLSLFSSLSLSLPLPSHSPLLLTTSLSHHSSLSHPTSLPLHTSSLHLPSPTSLPHSLTPPPPTLLPSRTHTLSPFFTLLFPPLSLSLSLAVAEEDGGAYSCVQGTQRPDIQHPEQTHIHQWILPETSYGVPTPNLPGLTNQPFNSITTMQLQGLELLDSQTPSLVCVVWGLGIDKAYTHTCACTYPLTTDRNLLWYLWYIFRWKKRFARDMLFVINKYTCVVLKYTVSMYIIAIE